MRQVDVRRAQASVQLLRELKKCDCGFPETHIRDAGFVFYEDIPDGPFKEGLLVGREIQGLTESHPAVREGVVNIRRHRPPQDGGN